MPTRFSILGAGSWGTTMAAHLQSAGHTTTLWHYRPDFIKQIAAARTHPHLDDFQLPAEVQLTSDVHAAVAAGSVLVVAVPSQNIRGVIGQIASEIDSTHRFVNLSKGIERHSLKRMSEVISEESGVGLERIVSLYGPSHAEEVARNIPTALVAASPGLEYAREIQQLFSTSNLRVYATQDIVGVELGGSIKNVIAIAAGICIGLGFGDNTMAALATRGLAEITRLGVASGANVLTFAGLSGVGDLTVTIYSRYSRNRRLGIEIGQGRKYEEAMEEMGMIAEGVYTAQSAIGLAERLSVEMPICREVHRILFEDKPPREAIADLMTRDLRDETLP